MKIFNPQPTFLAFFGGFVAHKAVAGNVGDRLTSFGEGFASGGFRRLASDDKRFNQAECSSQDQYTLALNVSPDSGHLSLLPMPTGNAA